MLKAIASSAIACALLVIPTQASAQVVALGASNTEGIGVGMARAYPAHLEKLLNASGVNVRVRNSGISGNTTAQMLARLDSAVPQGTKVVLFHAGGNDARRGISPSDRAGNIATINQRLSARGIHVIDISSAFQAARAGNLQPDGIHLTVAGHQRLAQGLVGQVAAAMK